MRRDRETTERPHANRRGVLKGAGIAGTGLLASLPAGAAADDHEEDDGETRGSVTFAESAVTHRIEFPSEEARRHSLIDVNTLPEHAVFEETGVLSYSHLTSSETAELLEEYSAVLWHKDYEGLPVEEVGSTEEVWIGVEAIDQPRLQHGVLIEDSYRPPGFNVIHEGELVQVSSEAGESVIEPGETIRQELPEQEVDVRVAYPPEETQEEERESPKVADETDPSPYTVETMTLLPTLQLKNYGHVDIRAPENWTPHEQDPTPEEVRDL